MSSGTKISELPESCAWAVAPETDTVGGLHADFVANVPSDPTIEQVMKLQEQAGGLDFWHDDKEDVYTLSDGEPIE